MKKQPYRFKIHDRFQIELKFDYPLSPSRPREEIRVETFCFLPSMLRLNSSTYGKDKFYQDLQTYTRYGTPRISLEKLLEPANELSPFCRVARAKNEFAGGTPPPQAAELVVYELRLLACIFRAETRDRRNLILDLLSKPQPALKDYEDAAYLAAHFMADSARVLGRVRELQREFLSPHLPDEIAKAFAYVDEAMSVQWEGVSGKLYQQFAQVLPQAPAGAETGIRCAEAARHLAAVMAGEEAYRRQAGYATVVDASAGAAAGRANEFFLYRMGVLKKFAQSTLFLSVHTHQGSRPLLFSLQAVAAMLAMLAYLILVLLFIPNLQDFNLPALLLFATAYAFKDRIKDALKQFFSQRMTGWLRDRETELIDHGPSKAPVGNVAEAFSFVEPRRMPQEVLALRAQDRLAELTEEGAPETVFKYEKAIRLYADQVFKIHRRVDRLNEILRLSIRNLLLHMDEPKKGLLLLDSMEPEARKTADPPDVWPEPPAPAGGHGEAFESKLAADRITEERAAREAGLTPLHRVRALKIYHVNLILRVLTRDEHGRWQADMEKFRLILSRDGIERVELPENGQTRLIFP